MVHTIKTQLSGDKAPGPDPHAHDVTTLFTKRDEETVDDYLWRLLHGGKLVGLHFRRNQMVDGFVAPFYCRFPGLVVEVDEAGPETKTAYRDRERAFARHGLQTLHIDGEALISKPGAALQDILKAARAAHTSATFVGSHGDKTELRSDD